MRGGFVLAAVLGMALPVAEAQEQIDRYDAMYGTPVDVSLSDLSSASAGSYENRAIRVHGRLEIDNAGTGRAYLLRDFGGSVYITPVREMAGLLDSDSLRWLGLECEVTGLFRGNNQTNPSSMQASGVIQFWKFTPPAEKPTKSMLEGAKGLPLEALVRDPGRSEGKTVSVVGKFRGRNLYGDLPLRSQRDSTDWVIKDELFAVWVSGRKPKGDGFELDAGLKRDTNKWLQVVGKVVTRGGVVYLQAMHVALTNEPRPAAEVKPPPPPPERPKVPPIIVFALPLDGEVEVPRNSRFFVQFSKDMDDATFKGRVVVRYSGPIRPGDRVFDGVRLLYDGGRRTLLIDPGDNLLPGRIVELLLLPGIVDIDGLELVPRSGKEKGGEALEVLRYRVGS
jgi:hypothetical protein